MRRASGVGAFVALCKYITMTPPGPAPALAIVREDNWVLLMYVLDIRNSVRWIYKKKNCEPRYIDAPTIDRARASDNRRAGHGGR